MGILGNILTGNIFTHRHRTENRTYFKLSSFFMVSGTEGRLVEPDNAFFPTMSLLKTGIKKKLKKGTKTLLQHKRETRSIFQKKNVSVQYKIIFTELINMTLTCYKQKFEIQEVLISILINHQGNNITSLNDLDIILVVAQNLLCQQNSAKKQSNAEFRFRVFALIYL